MTAPTPKFLTTRNAAAYCQMTPSGLVKAAARGQVRPAGKRGGRGVFMWSVEDLDRYLQGQPPIVHPPTPVPRTPVPRTPARLPQVREGKRR